MFLLSVHRSTICLDGINVQIILGGQRILGGGQLRRLFLDFDNLVGTSALVVHNLERILVIVVIVMTIVMAISVIAIIIIILALRFGILQPFNDWLRLLVHLVHHAFVGFALKRVFK